MKQFKKSVAVLMVLALCLSVFATMALAADKIKTTGKVNMRKGPSLAYAVIMSIGKGKTLTYTGTSQKDGRGVTWYKVTYSGKTGWVSSKYTKLVITTTSTILTTGIVYIRSGPSLAYKKMACIDKGQTASYLGEMKKDSRGVYWYYINYGGIKGWVSSKYCKFI